MKCIDWREASTDVVAPLYAAERARWARELEWDSAANWMVIEAARVLGALPGYLALDRSGEVAGWAFYTLQDDVLQVGGLTGRTHSVARTLLNTIMRSPEAARASDVACFVLPDQPATTAFVQRRFEGLAFLYLRRDLHEHQTGATDASVSVPTSAHAARLEPWGTPTDGPDTIRLLASAYGTSRAARCFAGHRGLDGWVHYLRQLINTPACGVLLPAASVAARAPDGTLCGAVLTTSIGPRAAHIAQLVVDPNHARQGLGRRLVDAACAVAASEGRRYMTLLVAEDNTAARALYARARFHQRSQFLFGWRARPIPRVATGSAAA